MPTRGGIDAVNPVECIKICFRKYADFSGRAGRPEFWWFFLFQVIVLTATSWIPVLSSIVTLLLLLPSLAVGARRLHDIGRTGWWLLLALIPFVGWIPLLIMAALPGTGGPNRYGSAPHSANALPPTGAHWPQGAGRNRAVGSIVRSAVRNGRRGTRGLASSAAPGFDWGSPPPGPL